MSKRLYTIDELKKLIIPILIKYGVDKAYLFGSYARGEATPESDIDILIKSEAIKSLFKLGGLYYELEEILNKSIDIITEETFTNQPTDELDEEFYEGILKERMLVYER
ncbi:MAG: nucleotidyltransferase domain-containing protein [Oscillospiraceae bacterium]|nr:nucleotidyltransferase domain-containing protein [Oscillospiraceae bacterium]